MLTARLFPLIVASALMMWTFGAAAGADQADFHAHRAAPAADAIALGRLAPAARRSTLVQDYGDAGLATSRDRRTRVSSRRANEGRRTPAVIAACGTRAAGAAGSACGCTTGGLAALLASPPAFVSSPQVVGQDPARETPIMPPITSLFYAFDGVVTGQAFAGPLR